MEFLRGNALKFLGLAEEMLERGDYGLAMFFVEQFFQLSLKYVLYRKYGDFPKTHSLRILFELTKEERYTEFYRENLDLLREIKLSHVASRYFDVEYSEGVARRAVGLARRFREVV
ncbi:HEPN domain-containing protein [Infirmifilum lucidum]|uniref:HEPN domain-containing protein n=1 Tax=Infirmifilum lucidum TaxID=2776706 RepID=A0A7L9FI20_9CREN|nr:HEPN domain-containing protein [Infirmifilum lucidum]QOJ79012.1 HEPN domain-containing protein [Infirmifilum lucidum]